MVSRRIRNFVALFLILILTVVVVWMLSPMAQDQLGTLEHQYSDTKHNCRGRYYIGLKAVDEHTTIIAVEYCCPEGSRAVHIAYGSIVGQNIIVLNKSLVEIATNLEETLQIDGKNICIYNVMIVHSYYHGIGDYDLVFTAGIRSK